MQITETIEIPNSDRVIFSNNIYHDSVKLKPKSEV